MLRILWSSRSAMSAQQEKLDSISNNLSNVNTEGYKRVDVSFKDLVYENLNRTGNPVTENGSNTSYNGTGIRTGEWVRDNKQGNLTETGVSSNLAIDGQGYFEVVLPERNPDGSVKTALTRNGNFNLDVNGDLVDDNGNRLNVIFNDNIPLEDRNFTSKNFIIDKEGKIVKNDNGNFTEMGKVNLYNVVSQDSLQSIGKNLYTVKTYQLNGNTIPVEQPYVTEEAEILQGFSELSNVDMAKEMTDMIITQRAFELSSRSMKTGDEMWGMANNLRSR